MATRLYTSFPMPNDPDNPIDDKIKYWIDVMEDYDTVCNQVYPAQMPSSALETRQNFLFTKLDGTRFSSPAPNIHGFEEIS